MEALLVKSVKIRKLKGLVSLDFEIPGPGVHLLAGSNGSGKTTLLACLRRLCHANSFQLHFLSSLQSNRLDTFNGAEVTYCLGTESVSRILVDLFGSRFLEPDRGCNLSGLNNLKQWHFRSPLGWRIEGGLSGQSRRLQLRECRWHRHGQGGREARSDGGAQAW